MSYTKQTWATGDTVTATKLNHIEDGIAGAGGFDAEITFGGDTNSMTATIVSGDYATLSDMLANNVYPLIRSNFDVSGMNGGVVLGSTAFQDEGFLSFAINNWGDLVVCEWASDGTLTAYLD